MSIKCQNITQELDKSILFYIPFDYKVLSPPSRAPDKINFSVITNKQNFDSHNLLDSYFLHIKMKTLRKVFLFAIYFALCMTGEN